MAGSRLVLPSQQPVQSTGLPYPGGQLFFYVSGTTTPTPTYADAALTTPNTNPVILDAAGDAGNVFLDPVIVYKIVLEDANSAQVWTFDPVYPFAPGNIQGLTFAGTSTGSGNAQALATIGTPVNGQTVIFVAGFTNTTSATLNGYLLYQQGSSGPAVLSGQEVQTGNLYAVSFETALNTQQGGWQLIGAVSPLGIGASEALLPVFAAETTEAAYIALGGLVVPSTGRLTLTSGVPVLTSTVLASATVLYTPFVGNQVAIWNATESAWGITTFSELTCTLSDSTLSPAAAVAQTVYDMFVWSHSGTVVLSRGPAWTNITTRALTLKRTNGILCNSADITNGPAAGFGLFVGTIATDPAAAAVTFNPVPAGASGGPVGGARIGLWNKYNKVGIVAAASDVTATWTYSTAAWRPADNSTNNRITFVAGDSDEGASANYLCPVSVSTAGGIGVAIDSTSSANVSAWSSGPYLSTPFAFLALGPLIGEHVIQAVEYADGSTTYNNIGGLAQLTASLHF